MAKTKTVLMAGTHPLDALLSLKDATLTTVASACGVTPQAVYDWRKRAKEGRFAIPAKHVAALAARFKVSKRSLRPDLY